MIGMIFSAPWLRSLESSVVVEQCEIGRNTDLTMIRSHAVCPKVSPLVANLHEQFEQQNVANPIENGRFELKNAANTIEMAASSSKC